MSFWESEADDEYLAADLQDLGEISDLGDLSDVPQHYLREVVELLRSLPGPDDAPGNTTSLREWIQDIKRMAGFSKQVTVQLFSTIAQCMEAPRPRGALTTRDDVQKAFVRLEGVTETINIMLMRLNDPEVVAQAARCFAACVQGSPIAAEALFSDGPNKMRLLLRAVERHGNDFGVIENACLLVMHLCSLPPQRQGSAAPPRLSAHKDCQGILASELGVIDLLVHFLELQIGRVAEATQKTEELHAHAIEKSRHAALHKAPARGSEPNVASKVDQAMGNMEVRNAWMNLNNVEVMGARIQELVLQTLLLFVFGNPDTTRQLMGEFWVWAHQQEEHEAQAAGLQAARHGQKKVTQKVPPQVEAARPRSESSGKRGNKHKASDKPQVAEPEFLTKEDKHNLSTLGAFGKVSTILLEVLRGRAARDRPELASKACRLLCVFADRNIHQFEHVEATRNMQRLEQEVRFRPGTIPADNREPGWPFLPLKPVLAALTFAMRTHKEDAPMLAHALSTIIKLKDLAMLSAPPGVEPRSDALRCSWQRLLADAEEQGELEASNTLLKRALEETDEANESMRLAGGTVDQLTGSSIWLTPRLRQTVAETTLGAAGLVGDAIAARWRNGEPLRLDRKSKKDKAIREGALRKTFDKDGNRSPAHGRRASIRQTWHPAAGEVQGSDKGISRGPKKHHTLMPDSAKHKGLIKNKGALKPPSKEEEKKKPKASLEMPEWKRAIGYETLDESEYDKTWHQPLQDALTRSLYMPCITSQRAQKAAEAQLLLEDVGEEGDTAPHVFSSASASVGGMHPATNTTINPQLLESTPGLLRTRILLPSMSKEQFKASGLRLRGLMKNDSAAEEIAASVCKHFRKAGCIMPTFGVNVQFKKGSRAAYEEEQGYPSVASGGG